MILKIDGKQYDYFEGVNLNLSYDSVASTFGLGLFYDPNNPAHKELCRPLAYKQIVLEEEGEVLLTGVIPNHHFKDLAASEPVTIEGYSLPGVLEDCPIPKKCYPLQTDGVSLKTITEKIIKPFGLKLIIDPAVAKKVNSIYKSIKARDSQGVKEYLSELASQKHVILTHNELGNLVYTEAKANAQPLYFYEPGKMGAVEMVLDIDGQQMHSEITVHKQASTDSPNAAQATVKNPYVSVFRPMVVRQSSGDEVDTKLCARNKLAEELKAIKLTITLSSWKLNGKLVRPNNIISIINPRLWLFNKTNFFIADVSYSGSGESQQAVLTCYLPEVYNGQTPKNIFA